jgi:hypothetical protein
MSRYYLHLRDFRGALVEDQDGSECSSVAVAKKEALLGMHELIAQAVHQGVEPAYEAIIIADERGAHLAAVPLVAALPSRIVGLLKHPEEVIPMDRFEDLRRNADECREKAEATDDYEEKKSWLKLADAWLHMLPETHSRDGAAGWPKSSNDPGTSH